MISMNPVVGIDCGKRYLDAALFPGTDRTRIENTPLGLATPVSWLAERSVGVAGLEASGGCERLARDALIEAGLVGSDLRTRARPPLRRRQGPTRQDRCDRRRLDRRVHRRFS